MSVLTSHRIDFSRSQLTKPANLANSAVLRMLEEEEERQRSGQSPGLKRVAWPPPPETEFENNISEEAQIQQQVPQPTHNIAPNPPLKVQVKPSYNQPQIPLNLRSHPQPQPQPQQQPQPQPQPQFQPQPQLQLQLQPQYHQPPVFSPQSPSQHNTSPRGWAHVKSPVSAPTTQPQFPSQYQPAAAPQIKPYEAQPYQPQPTQAFRPVTSSQFPPSTGLVTLKPQAPISQAPAPVYTSQPATAVLKGGSNMRGDQKWPPATVKAQSEAENEARRLLAKGPACRPRRPNKDYTKFFAQHALNSTYPGYRAPPGTQHYSENSGTSTY